MSNNHKHEHHKISYYAEQLGMNVKDLPTDNHRVLEWLCKWYKICKPNSLYWVTGSAEENQAMCDELVKKGTFIKLNEKYKPNSYLARSTLDDVARVEERTFICTADKEDAGPTNNWADPTEMMQKLEKLFDGCMKGRTMYVTPFGMGPLNSPYCRVGIEITDSAYVVVNMRIMTRMGTEVWNTLGDGDFLPCVHSVGYPLEKPEDEVSWPCNPNNKYICHFTDLPDRCIVSFGSGYGGNALLGKKCFALRLASCMGRSEGWLAEHMLILSLEPPHGHNYTVNGEKVKKFYVAAAFPSACGKTNLAMMVPTIPGWTVRCLGDDIGWLHVGPDGRLWGVNPEKGFFGVAPGTSEFSNHSAIVAMHENSIFTNVALTPDGDVWWEGLTKTKPAQLTDWLNKPWTPASTTPSSHPNSRYTTPASQCPVIDPDWESPYGVPISAIIFGGRRASTVPLVTESLSWDHGVFMGATCSSETTAAAAGAVGRVRRDPFAMLPFCGYNMGDYFNHWFHIGKRLGKHSPKIFYVNWFLKDEKNQFMWPGFGDNSRVLKWMCERISGTGKAISTPIGIIPDNSQKKGGLDFTGLDISPETIDKLFQVDASKWIAEIADIKSFFATMGDRLPEPLWEQLNQLEARLKQQQQ